MYFPVFWVGILLLLRWPIDCFKVAKIVNRIFCWMNLLLFVLQITLTPDQSILHVVAQSNLTGTVEGVFSQFPDVLLDAAIVRKYLNTETFYWKLPEQFQGDQVRTLNNWNALWITLLSDRQSFALE